MDAMNKQDDMDTTKSIRKTKQDRANAKRKFSRKIIGFRDMIENKGFFMAIKGKFEDVMDAFLQIERCNDLVTTAINETGPHHLIDKMLDECDDYMTEVERSMDDVRTKFAARSRDENVKLAEVNVRPLNSPQFSGNIRQYTSFKQDFNRLMTKQFGQDPYVLRQCLSGKPCIRLKE